MGCMTTNVDVTATNTSTTENAGLKNTRKNRADSFLSMFDLKQTLTVKERAESATLELCAGIFFAS